MIKVAACQYHIDLLPNWEAYADHLTALCEEAAGQGADLLLLPEYAGLVLTGPDGRPFRADLSLATWEVEQHGPLRVCIRIEGRHALADSDQILFGYILRLHVFRGRPFFRLEYTFVNDDQKSLMSRFHAIELRCSTTGKAGQMFLNSVPSAPGRVEQVDDLHHLVRGQEHPGHARGWAAVSGTVGGLALGVREAWQNWPKSFSWAPSSSKRRSAPSGPCAVKRRQVQLLRENTSFLDNHRLAATRTWSPDCQPETHR